LPLFLEENVYSFALKFPDFVRKEIANVLGMGKSLVDEYIRILNEG
jgi:hypothetical protein